MLVSIPTRFVEDMGCQKLTVLKKTEAFVKRKLKTGLTLIKMKLLFSVLVFVNIFHVLYLFESQVQVSDELFDSSRHRRDTHFEFCVLIHSCITVTFRNF